MLSRFLTTWTPPASDRKVWLFFAVLATLLLLLTGLLVRVGLGIRAGKRWAFLLFGAYALWTGYWQAHGLVLRIRELDPWLILNFIILYLLGKTAYLLYQHERWRAHLQHKSAQGS
ncbi:hypothetical protein LRS06_19680 [Hymenobacter sp. J193]|uniref:hypothetical protein n=1 Tax=Hymenobacter sp. J193 TaxID=2898429 RepID=UPI0021512168|nr:hypothetical protein [Hymenobacter sp. J193]MCR5889951.1 hypothetical protein [Hymenobacter sp. J193]